MKVIYISKSMNPKELKEASTSRMIENNMSCGVAEMLYFQYKEKLKCITLQPREKEKGYTRLARHRRVILPCGVETEILSGITTPILSVITGFITLIRALNKEVKTSIKDGDKDIVVITYNAGPQESVAIRFIYGKANITRIAVLFDAPVIVLNSTKIKNVILKIWNKVARYFFNKYDGAITVAKRCVTDFSNDMKYLQIIMGTCFGNTMIEVDKSELNNEIIICYAGNLAKHNGIELLIKSMKYLPQNYKLEIMGNGKLEDFVKGEAQKDVRIIFKGLVTSKEVLEAYSKSHILTIIRCGGDSVSDYLLKYGTSSKLSELLMTGKPVITSEIEANPEEFSKFVNIIQDLEPKNIALRILDITKDKESYQTYCNKAILGREYYIKNGTWEYQSTKVYDFIESLMKNKN